MVRYGFRSKGRLFIALLASFLVAFPLSADLEAQASSSSKSWGPRTSSYKNVVRVQGSGTFSQNAGTASSQIYVKDRSKDGNTTYGKTGFYVLKNKWDNGTGGYYQEWVHQGTSSTNEYADALNATRVATLQKNLPVNGFSARGEVWVCAQMGWPVPDKCTTRAILTLDY